MVNVVAPIIITVIPMSVVTDRFKQGSLEVVAVVLTHTTVTRRFAVVVKSIAKRPEVFAVLTEFTTPRFQCAATVGYFQNGVGLLVVNHATITVKASCAAMVKLFRRCMVLHVVVQKRIGQMFMFAVITRSILVVTESGVVALRVTKAAKKFVVLAEFYPRAVVHYVVVP